MQATLIIAAASALLFADIAQAAEIKVLASGATKEAYLELNAPVLSGVTMAELLEFNGAVRVFDYSTSGSDSTLEAGVNWMS